jgi:hypothetical protein
MCASVSEILKKQEDGIIGSLKGKIESFLEVNLGLRNILQTS